MKTNTGLWIDHRKAIIVTENDAGEAIKLVVSKVEKQLRRTGDSPLKGSFESRQVPMSDSRQKEFTEHLNIYYDAVISCIRDSDAILLFGPGEAKDELKKRLEKNRLGGRIAETLAADKMTDRQVALKVKKYFAR